MPLTPDDVSNKRFTPVRLREGYDMGEVDQFLDEVEAELARLTQENDELRSRLSSAQAGAPVAPMDLPPRQPEVVEQPPAQEPTGPTVMVPGPPETIRVETTQQASSAATRLLELATRNADELVDEARRDADRIVGEARVEADRMVGDAKKHSDTMEADARSRAQMLDAETAERRHTMLGDLEKERDKLGSDVDGLRSFEREYRSRLKAYFSSQLEALEQNGDSAPAPTGEDTPAPKRLRSILGEDEG